MKISYGKQWITEEDKRMVQEVLDSDFLTTGPYVRKFEEIFAKYVNAKYAIAVSNGTAALHLAAQALGVRNGNEIITTPISFAATANCILYNSGKPIFSEVTDRGLINPDEIKKNITKNTTGLVPVHYMGLPCELDELSQIADENNLFLLEDACHAVGAKYKGSKIGSCKYSNLSVFSFHPVKHITTGEGGMITTNDEEIAHLLRTIRTHGITKDVSEFKTPHDEPWYQEMQFLGYNYRLTDLQAALGLSQLNKLTSFIERRREIAERYSEFFETFSNKVEIIQENDNEFHSYHLYVIKFRDSSIRRHVFEELAKEGIFCQIHYIPIYWHPYYQELGYDKVQLPNAEDFYNRILSIPMYPAITDDELEFILHSFSDILKKI